MELPIRPVSPYFLLALLIVSLIAGCGSPAYRKAPPPSDFSTQVIQSARGQLGVPYQYGGSSPETGFDCSGLVFYTHQHAGITLPRTTFAQYKYSRPVTRRHLQPGDLVFFRINRRRISHVGIYLGDNYFIHAPSSGKSVSIAHLGNPYWQKRFTRGGRLY